MRLSAVTAFRDFDMVDAVLAKENHEHAAKELPSLQDALAKIPVVQRLPEDARTELRERLSRAVDLDPALTSSLPDSVEKLGSLGLMYVAHLVPSLVEPIPAETKTISFEPINHLIADDPKSAFHILNDVYPRVAGLAGPEIYTASFEKIAAWAVLIPRESRYEAIDGLCAAVFSIPAGCVNGAEEYHTIAERFITEVTNPLALCALKGVRKADLSVEDLCAIINLKDDLPGRARSISLNTDAIAATATNRFLVAYSSGIWAPSNNFTTAQAQYASRWTLWDNRAISPLSICPFTYRSTNTSSCRQTQNLEQLSDKLARTYQVVTDPCEFIGKQMSKAGFDDGAIRTVIRPGIEKPIRGILQVSSDNLSSEEAIDLVNACLPCAPFLAGIHGDYLTINPRAERQRFLWATIRMLEDLQTEMSRHFDSKVKDLRISRLIRAIENALERRHPSRLGDLVFVAGKNVIDANYDAQGKCCIGNYWPELKQRNFQPVRIVDSNSGCIIGALFLLRRDVLGHAGIIACGIQLDRARVRSADYSMVTKAVKQYLAHASSELLGSVRVFQAVGQKRGAAEPIDDGRISNISEIAKTFVFKNDPILELGVAEQFFFPADFDRPVRWLVDISRRLNN